MANADQPTTEETQMPQILLETAGRRRGLILLCGDRYSGLSATASALWKKIAAGDRHGLYLTSGEMFPRIDLPVGVKTIDADRETSVEARREIAAADVIFVDGSFDRDRLDRLCTWVEEGRLVVALQSAPAPLVALRRWLGRLSGEGRAHMIWRLCDTLQLCLGQMSVPALGGDRMLAHEVILMTPMLRAALENENLHAADETLKLGDETAGTVSFNQSLLQHLIRRRIDMRTAFEATRDPIDLDQLLKKVGL